MFVYLLATLAFLAAAGLAASMAYYSRKRNELALRALGLVTFLLFFVSAGIVIVLGKENTGAMSVSTLSGMLGYFTGALLSAPFVKQEQLLRQAYQK